MLFERTVELRERDDWHIEPVRQRLQAARDLGDFRWANRERISMTLTYTYEFCATNRKATPMTRVLFLCGKNRLRSPTAEQVFSSWAGVETDSAGVNHDADCPVSEEQVRWASLIVVMEKAHLAKLRRGFRGVLGHARVVCVDIPDDFAYMQPELVELLEHRVGRYLRR